MIKIEHGAVIVNGVLSELMAEACIVVSSVDKCIRDAADGNEEEAKALTKAFDKGMKLARATTADESDIDFSSSEMEDAGKAAAALDIISQILKSHEDKENN